MLFPSISLAQGDAGLGQTIQINIGLDDFVGRPQWLLVIRDVDHNLNVPYLFDIEKLNDFFLVFTRGRNYIILASTLQFSPYKRFPFTQRKIHNFCHLQSDGRIIKDESITIQLSGRLTPNERSYECHVSRYADYQFPIVPQKNNN